MNYHASLGSNARADIRRMPKAVAQYTLAQLKSLELNPTLLSHRSHFPFREKCQIFSFDYDHAGERYFINVLFQYGADEQTLYISDAPFTHVTEWWEDGDNDWSI